MWLYECFSVSLIFGVITCAAGVTGVVIGIYSAGILRKITPKADPLICGVGLIAGAPFLYLAIVCSNHSTVATWVNIFICAVMLKVETVIQFTPAPVKLEQTTELCNVIMMH